MGTQVASEVVVQAGDYVLDFMDQLLNRAQTRSTAESKKVTRTQHVLQVLFSLRSKYTVGRLGH